MSSQPETTRLQLCSISKDYSVRVLDQVDFELRAGEIHALLGANGAGKSTMCKIISGLISSSEGFMELDRQSYSPNNKQEAESLGVQIVQQELNLISTLSVAENIMLNRLPNRFGFVNRKRMHETARAALDRFGLKEIETNVPVSRLGVGQQQMVEIASVLDRECSVLILDEPTAALSAGETKRLFESLLELKSRGVGIIYISHRLDEISEISDRLTVLRDGKFVATRNTSEVDADQMVELMSGESSIEHKNSAGRKAKSFSEQPTKISVNSMSRNPIVKDVSFSVKGGERFGIAGLVGSGRTELLRLIFGADKADEGFITLGESLEKKCFSHPREAVKNGIAMVTEDRKQNGLLLPQSIRTNTTLSNMSRVKSFAGIINHRLENQLAETKRQEMDTRCTSLEQTVGTLSGGNQQKVAVAKWLLTDAEVYLFDEPTRGIDVAARRKIHKLFENLYDQGKAIIIVSSDLEELFETCDRIGVMSAGKMVATFSSDEFDSDEIMKAAFSGHLSESQNEKEMAI